MLRCDMDLENLEIMLARIANKSASRKDIKTYKILKRNEDIMLAIAWPSYRRKAEKALRRTNSYLFSLD